ncbi:MAG: hypothetical protein ABL857_05355, partial [Rickettsiales bacterium]
IDYPITKELHEYFLGLTDNLDFYCPDKNCTCEENVAYLQFGGKAKGAEKINAQEKKQAEKYKCNVDNATVQHIPEFSYASSDLISIAMYNLEYGRTSGGSCHGNHQFVTYDAETGNEYKLKDIVGESNVPSVHDVLVNGFIRHYAEPDAAEIKDKNKYQRYMEGIKKSLQRYFMREPLEKAGFIVENGKLYVNIGEFMLSCAGGSFYPAELPEKFIKPEFLQKMKK